MRVKSNEFAELVATALSAAATGTAATLAAVSTATAGTTALA
jgi:hypothetical protein